TSPPTSPLYPLPLHDALPISAAAPLGPPFRRPRRPRSDRGPRADVPRPAARRGRDHGRPVAAGAPWGAPAGAGTRADRGPHRAGPRDPRQPRRGVVDATVDPVREGAVVREVRALLRRGPGAHAGAPRGHPRERPHLARGGVGLA